MECPSCNGEKQLKMGCGHCSSSGEGMTESGSCYFCKGTGSLGLVDCLECGGHGHLVCTGCGENVPLLESKEGLFCLDCIVYEREEGESCNR